MSSRTRSAPGALACRRCREPITPDQKRVSTGAGPMHEQCYALHDQETTAIHRRMMAGYDRAAAGGADAIFFHKQRHTMGSGILFLGTTSAGRPDFTKQPEQQPRIVQLAAMLTEEGAFTRAQFSTLIRPDDWTIPPEVQDVHHIDTADCERFGVPICIALATLARLAECAKLVVCHNAEFDILIVRGEYARLGLTLFNRADKELPSFCTMLAATEVCRLPGKIPGRFKWPSLAEAHRHFFQSDFDGAHDVMADVQACARIYFAMNKGMEGARV